MTLHDRIMDLRDGRKPNSDLWDGGYVSGINDASEIAKESDELMAEMAKALADYAWIEDAEGEGANVANNALNSYYKWKEIAK